jgi:hypothetical protein
MFDIFGYGHVLDFVVSWEIVTWLISFVFNWVLIVVNTGNN